MLAQINIIVLLLWYAALALHPLHITITNIDYNKSKGQIEVSIKIFKDDFEWVLSQQSKKKVNLDDEQNQRENDSIISRYVEENFKLEMEGRKMKLTLKDKLIEDDAVWLNYSVENKLKGGNLKVDNRLLTKIYNDQKNLVIVTFDSQQKGFTLSKDESVFSLALD